MKPKNKIKLHKSVIEAINSAIELVNSMIELHKLKQKPIPEYKKGAKEGGLMIVGQGSAEKETIVRPDGKEVLLKGKPIIFQSDIEKGVICSQEDWSKKLNEYLKEKGLNDSQPFGFAPIEDKEPKVDLSAVYKIDKEKLKQRQIEIGKEIEKLRIEARTIKNQLKDSN